MVRRCESFACFPLCRLTATVVSTPSSRWKSPVVWAHPSRVKSHFLEKVCYIVLVSNCIALAWLPLVVPQECHREVAVLTDREHPGQRWRTSYPRQSEPMLVVEGRQTTSRRWIVGLLWRWKDCRETKSGDIRSLLNLRSSSARVLEIASRKESYCFHWWSARGAGKDSACCWSMLLHTHFFCFQRDCELRENVFSKMKLLKICWMTIRQIIEHIYSLFYQWY